MFFIGGITSKQKQLDFNQSILCSHCRKFGRYEVYMEYMEFSMFFIPLFKWSRNFFVKTTCCDTLYALDKEKGERILRGEELTLAEEDLQVIHEGEYRKYCPDCGGEILPEYRFCPHCGRKFKH